MHEEDGSTGDRRPRAGVGVYTPDLAARLTTVPKSTLTAWRASGLLPPGLQLAFPRARRAYTYNDLGAIMLIRELRGRGLPMQRLRKAAVWFESQARSGEHWANRRVWTDGRDLFMFESDETPGGPIAASRGGQQGCSVMLPDVVEGLRREMPPKLRDLARHVEIAPEIEAGQPVIRGRRLTTALVASIAGPNADVARVRDIYPDLTSAEIQAAVGFEKALGRLAA